MISSGPSLIDNSKGNTLVLAFTLTTSRITIMNVKYSNAIMLYRDIRPSVERLIDGWMTLNGN